MAESKKKKNNRNRSPAPCNTLHGAKTTLDMIKPSDLWYITKKGNTITHDSVKYD